MKKLLLSLAAVLSSFLPASADTIILRDGASYSGQLQGAATVTFKDSKGIGYQFPRRDVQSLVFTPVLDTVILHSGRSYSGHYTGANPLAFMGGEGIKYEFPVDDVQTVIFDDTPAPVQSTNGTIRVIPTNSDVVVRTDETIDSGNAQPGQLYRATITEGVIDSAGKVAIPAGTPARLLIRQTKTGGAVHSPELVLDLYSVTINGREYRVVSTDVAESSRRGLGANRRTAEYVGGGTALGALLGGIFGGGKGAGIGALAGAGGGTLTQVFTRGKRISIPAESVLRFRLERTLVLRSRP
jgi:hypothetical protein